eukprot:8508577-Alexandrium_andersonii.AAC.1
MCIRDRHRPQGRSSHTAARAMQPHRPKGEAAAPPHASGAATTPTQGEAATPPGAKIQQVTWSSARSGRRATSNQNLDTKSSPSSASSQLKAGALKSCPVQ